MIGRCWRVVLLGLSAVYTRGSDLHRRLTRLRGLSRPVLSVGGLSVGGAGKTPMTAWLAGRLRACGIRVAILSRGYGRRGRGIEFVRHELESAPLRFGDEPVWLARWTGAPVVVGRDRWRAGCWWLEQAKVDLFLLDDGFQHWRLDRECDLVVLDTSLDPGEIRVLPVGCYREGLSALGRADAVILNRCGQAPPGRVEEWKARISGFMKGSPGEPRIFQARLRPARLWVVHEGGGRAFPGVAGTRVSGSGGAWSFGEAMANGVGMASGGGRRGTRAVGVGPAAGSGTQPGVAALNGFVSASRMPERVFLLSGVAAPESFGRSVEECGMKVLGHKALRDHSPFSAEGLVGLCSRASRMGAEALVVTEKDAVRMEGLMVNVPGFGGEFPLPILALGIEVEIAGAERLIETLLARLGLDGRGPGGWRKP